CVDIIVDKEKTLVEKTSAFDELELLVEQSDNANGTLEEELRMFAAWTMGTAVQNNFKAQQACLNLTAVLAAIRNNKDNFDAFININGLKICIDVCKEGDSALLKRMLFFFTALLQDMEEEPVVAETTVRAIDEHGLVDMVVQALSSQDPQVEEYLQWLLLMATNYPATVEDCKDKLSQTLTELKEQLDVEGQEEISQLIGSLQHLLS
ncbi:hsp70 nucleotide exchange factor fes1, partial [Kappamyces sp. JEL0680]